MNHTSLSKTRKALFAGLIGVALVAASCSSDKAAAPAATTTSTTATPATDATPATNATPATDAVPATAAVDPTTVATDAPVTTDAAPTGSPIVLALIADASGPVAGSQKFAEKATNAWADFVNAKGGLNGHPVTVEFRDIKGDAAASQAAVDELVAKSPTAWVLMASSTESAIAESLQKSNIPVLGTGYNPAIWGGDIEAFKLHCSTDPGAPVACALPNAFTITTTFGAVVDEQVFGAQAAGATKLAVAACAEVDSCSQANPVFETTAKALGLELGTSVKVSASAPDYSAECIGFVQEGVDFIQISASGDLGVKLFQDCADQGYTGIFGASAGTVTGDLLTTKGITLAGGLNAFPWWVDDAPVKEFRDAMKDGGLTEAEWAGPGITGLWSSLQLFAKALSNTKLTATDDIAAADALKAMYTIKDETLGGLISPITFTEGQRAAARPCFWPYILKDGVLTNPLGGLKYQCYPAEAG